MKNKVVEEVILHTPLSDITDELTFKYIVVGNIIAATSTQNKGDIPYNGANSSTAYGLHSVGDLQAMVTQQSLSLPYRWTVPFGKMEFYFTNATNYPVILWIYDCVPRKDIATGMTKIATPVTAWGYGYANEGGTGSDQSSAVFATPFESKLFCENYKVINVKKILMGGGDLHEHRVVNIQKNWIDSARYTDQGGTATITYLRNYTVMTFAVVSGTPIHDASNPTTQANVTTGPAHIDYVCKKEYIYKVGSYNQRYVNSTNYMGTLMGAPVTTIIGDNQASTTAGG
jgi:hypothetical protein